MVKPNDHSSEDTERGDGHIIRKHGRTSSSDQANIQTSIMPKSIQFDLPPTSPSRPRSARPETKRRKSSTSAGSKHKSRPAYSRKYSTPPSRPLSPAGFPKHLDLDMAIPEIDLNVNTSIADQLTSINSKLVSAERPSFPVRSYSQPEWQVEVDTAPQEPDIWSDPETDYFSSIEGPGPRHARGKSRRQVSQNMGGVGSLNALMASGGGGGGQGLQQISEEKEGEYALVGMPGGFAA